MIKINLLNNFSQGAGLGASSAILSEDDEKKQILLDFAKRFLVLVIGPLGFYIYEMQTIPELQKKLNEVNASYNELKQFNDSKQGLAEEIRKYEEEQNRYNAQMDFIMKITRDKVNEYKLFQHLKESTPNNVWINKLEFANNSLLISAESDDAKEIEKFIQRLSNTEFILNLVPLNQVNKKDFEGLGVTTTLFTVKAQLGSGTPQ